MRATPTYTDLDRLRWVLKRLRKEGWNTALDFPCCTEHAERALCKPGKNAAFISDEMSVYGLGQFFREDQPICLDCLTDEDEERALILLAEAGFIIYQKTIGSLRMFYLVAENFRFNSDRF